MIVFTTYKVIPVNSTINQTMFICSSTVVFVHSAILSIKRMKANLIFPLSSQFIIICSINEKFNTRTNKFVTSGGKKFHEIISTPLNKRIYFRFNPKYAIIIYPISPIQLILEYGTMCSVDLNNHNNRLRKNIS